MDAKRIHRLEQDSAALRELAAKMAAYRHALVEHGFARDEANLMVMAYQSEMVRAILGRAPDGT